MIRRIEAHRYRSLYALSTELRPLHLLVGPNASGKSTFLDVVNLLGGLLRDGLDRNRRREADLGTLFATGILG